MRHLFVAALLLFAGAAALGFNPVSPDEQPPDEGTRARALRDFLLTPMERLKNKPMNGEIAFDEGTQLQDALGVLREIFSTENMPLRFVFDDRAFKAEGLDVPVDTLPIRLRKTHNLKPNLAFVLSALCSQLQPPASFRILPDHVEITTARRLRPECWPQLERELIPTVFATFEQVELADALRKLADVSGISIVLGATEKGRAPVTARLNQVPLDTAVRLLADSADLKVVAVDTALYVTTKTKAEELEADLQKQRQQREQTAPKEPQAK